MAKLLHLGKKKIKSFVLRSIFRNFATKFKFLYHLIEKHIVLEDIDPVIFYGVGNGHLQMIRSLFPKLRIMARDNVVRVLGDEEQMATFEEATEKLRNHVMQFNSLKEEDILDIVKGSGCSGVSGWKIISGCYCR